MKISLVGFMGTGKSSVGQIVARLLHVMFLETDNIIEKETGLSIPDIFSLHGEAYFRQKETEILEKIIKKDEDYVLATGGGIILAAHNRALLKENTFPVLLEASPREIYRRTRSDGKRPLLEGKDPLTKIKRLLAERKDCYYQFDNRIITDGKNLDVIAGEIVKMMGVEEHGQTE